MEMYRCMPDGNIKHIIAIGVFTAIIAIAALIVIFGVPPDAKAYIEAITQALVMSIPTIMAYYFKSEHKQHEKVKLNAREDGKGIEDVSEKGCIKGNDIKKAENEQEI